MNKIEPMSIVMQSANRNIGLGIKITISIAKIKMNW